MLKLTPFINMWSLRSDEVFQMWMACIGLKFLMFSTTLWNHRALLTIHVCVYQLAHILQIIWVSEWLLFNANSAIFIRPSRDGPYYVIGKSGVHTGFHTITLVLYIGSLPNLATWFPCGRGRTLFILGSLCQRSMSPLL